MSDPHRAGRDRTKSPPGDAAATPAREAASLAASAGPAPAWAASHLPAPFGLAGVQRKVTIGPAGDAYEREADRVSADVASGRSIAPSAISPMGALGPIGQRTSASGKKPEPERRPEQDKKPPIDPKAEKDKKHDAPAAAVQKAPSRAAKQAPTAPKEREKDKEKEKVPDEKLADAPVQKADAPAPAPAAAPKEGDKKDKKKEGEKKNAGDKKDDKGKAKSEEKSKSTKGKEGDKKAVQKADAPKDRDKKAPEKKTPEKKASEKKAPEKKPEEKSKAAPAQKAAAPAPPAAAKDADKEKDKDKTKPSAKAKEPEKKPAAEKKGPDQKGQDKKKDDKAKPAAVQKAAAPAASDADKGQQKDRELEKEKDRKKASDDQDVKEKGKVKEKEKPKDKKKAQVKPDEPPPAAPAQRAGAGQTTPAMESAASSAVQNRGAGAPMQAGTRSALESRMGVDLSGVRVHQNRAAADASEAIQARAFTHGNDVYLGRGESQSNLGLMAHEATHVVQQSGGAHRMLIQRDPAAPADEESWDYKGKEGKVKKGSKFSIPSLRVPDVKKPFTSGPLTLPKKTGEDRPSDQRTVWEQAAREGGGVADKLAKKKKAEKAPTLANGVTFLRLKGQDTYVIGNDTAITNRMLRPYWDKNGKIKFYDVDHQLELQLGGSNDISNMWLLESKANQSSGREIRAERDEKITKLLGAAEAAGTWSGDAPSLDTIRASYTVTFERVLGGLPIEGQPSERWSIEEIRDQAVQLDSFKVLSKKQIDEQKLQGSPDTVAIYTNPTGGGLRKSEGWKEGDAEKAVKWDYGKLFQINKVAFDQASKKGSVSGVGFRNSPLIDTIPVRFDVQESDAVEYGGYVSTASVTREIQSKLKLKGLSPIEITQAELTEKGLVGRGLVTPTIPLLKDLKIDLVLDGENIYLSKVFSSGDLNFGGPFKVTGASLEIFAGTQGLGARGDVFFEIERVGKGQITGKAGTGGFSLEGKFDFDSEFFKPATVEVWYREGKFGGHGALGIPEGKVRGIKSAKLEATIDGDKIDASGSVKPSIPGVEQGDLKFSYDPKTGIVIGGKLELKKDIPGLEGGSVTAELSKPAGGDKWKLKASGEATPKIPGVSSKLSVSYDDGAFDAVVVAGYEKGMLKGSITVGATNRPVGEDGKPAGPPPEKGDTVTLYGGGTVTLKIAPWLQATAGIKLLPNGEIEVTGEIGLPSALEIFKEKKLDKNIFTIGIDIPIVGVSVLGQHIGIFANISGGLDLSAGIGPGELNGLKLAVTYNPAHEENTTVTGDANLHIPAHAGLRLFVRGSLGVGIPIVSASAGLEIGGSLGVEGALDAGVHVEWSPAKGLDLTAQAGIYVEPKLKFDITGFVLVEADLLFSTIELYSKRWQLAAFEYGSGLRFGLKFPIHYQEGQPFDISLNDVEFEVPKIDPGELLGGLIDKIA